MKVFADLHHGDLYYSLYLLFEQRLGWELYRPIGLDWFNEGYWKIAEPYGNAMDTVGQYLDINKNGYHPYKNLNGEHYVEDEIYYTYDPGHSYYHRAITLEKFKDMDFDIILPTYEQHEGPYLDLRDLYQPRAKMVAQMGNTGQKSVMPNVLHSVPYTPIEGQRAFYYHQEIDPTLYSYIPPDPETKKLFSFVNMLPYPEKYKAYKKALIGIEMRAYGADCPDGALFGSNGVSEKMRKANAGWHLKPQGGIGHSSMGWLASGRPVITNMSQHRVWGGDAISLFEPGVTCLDIESMTFEEGCREIRKMMEPENNLVWAERTLRRFNDIINYEREAEGLIKFIGDLI